MVNQTDINNIIVKTFKVQGLDLIITTPSGKTETIENGLSEIILGNLSLSSEKGIPLTQDEILSSIHMSVGADAVYIKEQFKSDFVEVTDKQNNEELLEEKMQFGESLSELQKKNQELKEALSQLEAANEQQEEQLTSSNTKLNKVKQQLSQQQKTEKSQSEKSSEITPPTPSVAPPPSSAASSSSAPVSAPKIAPVNPKSPLFIKGGLTEESDSFKAGDNITFVNKPVFEGAISPDAKGYLLLDGQKYSITADAKGQWSLALTTPLKDGKYQYELIATRDDGESITLESEMTIDTQLDSLSVGLDKHTDTGIVGDGITNNRLPTFTGMAEIGSQVILTIGSQKLSTLANAQGVWRIALGEALPDGETSYQVTAVDAAGNEKTEASTVTVKTSSPNFTLQLDGQTDFKTRNTQPVFSGKTEAEAEVLVIIDNKHYPTKADAQGNWSLSVTHSLADGNHLLSVQVTDVVGNLSSSTHNLWVDTVAPSSEARLAAEHDSGLVGDNLTNKQNISLVGMTKPQATVQVTFDGENFSAIADNDGQWRVALPKIMQDGDYSYQVNIVDSLGNHAQSNGQFTLDTTIELTAELDGASQSQTLQDEKATHSPRPQLSGSADPHSKIIAEFKGTTKTAYADEQGKWSLMFDVDADVGEDNHYLVSAEDMAGNYKQLKQSFSYFPNSTSAEANVIPPTVTVELSKNSDSGKKGDGITQVTKPIFEGTATKGAKIQFEIAGKTYDTMADRKTGLWQVKTDSLDEGNNTYFVTATRLDNGLKTQVQGHVFVDTHTPSSTVELTPETDSGTKGNFITNHRNPVFTGQGEANSEVTLVVAQQTLSTTTDKNGQWSIKLDKTLPENFMGNFRVSIKDAADNTFERKGTLVIDNSKPELSKIELMSPSNKSKNHVGLATHDLTPEFRGKASPSAKLNVSFNIDKQTHNFPITEIDNNGNWTFSFPKGMLVNDRRYVIDNISVTATSEAGNISRKEFAQSIQVKEMLLDITSEVSVQSSMTGLAGSNLSVSRSPKLQGTLRGNFYHDELSGYIDIGGKKYNLSLAGGGREWSVQLPENTSLPTGENSYTLVFKDVYGSEHKFSSYIVVSDFKFWLDPGTDTGRLGDQLTHHQQPAYKGKVEIGTQLSAKVNGAHHSIDVNDKGEWRFDVPIKGDGTYDIEFVLENNGLIAGKTSLTIDSTPPIFMDSGIAEADCHLGTQVAKNNHFNTTLTYEDEIDYVLVEVNGQQFKQAKIVTPFDGKTMQLGGEIHLPNGEHAAKITAFDLAGNKQVQDVILHVLDEKMASNPSQIQLGSHEKLLAPAQNSDIKFNENTLTLMGTGSPASEMTVKDANGHQLGRAKADNSGVWTLSLPSDIVQSGMKNGDLVALEISSKDILGRETKTQIELVYHNQPPEITGGADNIIVVDNQQINIKTPSFSGKTDAYALVSLTLAGLTHQSVADSDGNWTITLSEFDALKDGQYDYHIEAKDIYGLTSTQNIDTSLVVKTLPQFTGGLDTNSDTGRTGDNLTSQKMPILSGTTEPNATVYIEFQDSHYSTRSDAQGNWRIETSQPLIDGEHRYDVTVTDPHQGISGEFSGQFTIDTTAPDSTVGLTPETDGAITGRFVTNHKKPIFTGKTEANSQVELTLNNKTVSVTSDEKGAWQLELDTELPEKFSGEYQVKITDIAGNSSTETGTLIIENDKPYLSEITLLSDWQNDRKGVKTSSDLTPLFSGKAEVGAKLEFKFTHSSNSKKVHAYPITDIDSNGNWIFKVPSGVFAPDKTHEIDHVHVTAISPAGNVNSKSFDKHGMWVKKTDFIIESHVDDGANNDMHLSASPTPKLSGTIKNASHNDELKGEIQIAGKHYQLVFTDKNTKWSVEIPNDAQLAKGDNQYTLTFTDVYKNKTQFSSYVTVSDFKFWFSPETDSGQLGDFITSHKTPVYKGTASIGASLSAKIGDESYSIPVDEKGDWRFEVPIHKDGAYDITFIQESNGVTLGKTTLNLDTTEPTYEKYWVHWNDEHKDTNIANTNSPRIYFIYHDDVNKLSVSVNDKKFELSEINSEFNGSKVHIGGTFDLPNGEHLAKITATDKAGNAFEHDVVLKILGGEQGANPPKISVGIHEKQLVSQPNGKLAFNDNTLKLIGFTTPASEIDVKNTQGHLLGKAKANNEGRWELLLPSDLISVDIQHDENVNLIVSAKDMLGRETQLDFNLIYDNLPPEITGDVSDVLVVDKQQINTKTPSFAGKTDAYAKVSVILAGKVYSALADASGDWSFTLPERDALDDGVHSYRIEAQDILGLISTQKVEGSLTVKTTPQLDNQLSPDFDSGVLGDNLTNHARPKLMGITEPHASLRLVFDNKLVDAYDAKADEHGHWSVQVTQPLVDGFHSYEITVKDAVQGLEGKIEGQLTIDTQAPQFISTEIQAVANIHSNKESLIFKGVAEPDAKVVVTLDNQRHDSVSVGKNGEWEFKIERTTQYEDIQYSIEIEDLAGNKSFSEGVISEEASVFPNDGNTSMIIELQAPDFTISPAIDDIHF